MAATPSFPDSSNPRPSRQFAVTLLTGIMLTFTLLYSILPASLTEIPTDDLILRTEIIAQPSATVSRKLTTKIAFLADAGLNQASSRVLQLIKDEGCDIVLHQGDLDYMGKAQEFFASVDDVLGKDFPYFITMGNYESKRGKGREVAWDAYYNVFKARLKRVKDVKCAVVAFRNLACEYEGVSFVTSAIGVNASRLGLDLRELKTAQAAVWGGSEEDRANRNIRPTWRFCSWHLPMIDFQIGFREGVPWMSSPKLVEAYEACRARGAAILTGHEHYYVRSHTIRRFAADSKLVKYEQSYIDVLSNGLDFATHVSNDSAQGSLSSKQRKRVEVVKLGPGSSFAVVSGLGGHSVSIPSEERVEAFPHLAAVHPIDLMTREDPNGKVFYPRVTGGYSETSSNRIDKEVDPTVGYPFGALICSLQKSTAQRANGLCYFKTISGKVVDTFVVHRF